jgi:Cys-rich protein (TIGR01571 family)
MNISYIFFIFGQPEGGVKEGQRFVVPVSLPAAMGEATPLTGFSYSDDTSPRGLWKDSLCDCLSLGPCHPSLWCAWCCPQILMAQVLTRMNMSWLGERNSSQAASTFKTVVCLVVAYYVLSSLLAPPKPVPRVTGDDDVDINVEWIQPDANPLTYMLYQLVNLAFGLYTLVVMVRLRAAVREKYSLPNQTPCGDTVEDVCCSCFCGCCTVSQLARHTADYHERRALCCSSTGLPPSHDTAVHMVV